MIKKETFIKNSNIFLRYLQREISENKKDMNQHIETFKNLKKQKTISKQNLERFQNKKVPLKAKIPLIGRPFKNKYITEYNNAINETKKYRTELQNLKKKILYIQSNISKLNKIGSKTKKNIEFFVFNFENLDKESHQELMKYINKIEFLKRKSAQENMFSEILDIAKTFNSLVVSKYEIIENKKKHQKPKTISTKQNNTNVNHTEDEVKIFLPVPISLRHEAKRLGANYDPNANYGSRMYINFNDKNVRAKTQHLLPIAYRDKKEPFKFPPIRFHAKGQNLWTIFNKETWNYIRSMMYSQTGNRCMICGAQGGKIIDSVFTDESQKKTSVECHEVWDWEVPDPQNGVGIQKLKKLLVLCVDCHMMFHEDFAVNKANEYGKSDKVKDFLQKRKSLVNSMSLEQIQELDAKEREELEKNNGVDKWIIDLSTLSEQDFMKHHVPILKEDNDAVVTEDLIAGIDFENEYGDLYESKLASEIYAKIISDIDRELEETAMPYEESYTDNIQLKMF